MSSAQNSTNKATPNPAQDSAQNSTQSSAQNPPIQYYFDEKFIDYIKTEPFTQKEYDLSSRKERYEYFRQKAGDKIDFIKEKLYETDLVLYLLAPKFGGKGVYTGMLMEIFGHDKFHHLSVGDIVRAFPETYKNEKQQLLDFLKQDYRGEMPLDEAINLTLNPDPTKTLPDSFILSLLKYEIHKRPKKSLIIDGFPRTEDQVTYSLLFRQLINYKDDIDIFVLINVPYAVLDARAKYRVVCPKCHNSRNLRYLPTANVGYDEKTGEFYLMCDNPSCNNQRMGAKPGDELGIKKYEARIIRENNLMNLARSMHGVAHVELFNAVPVEIGDKYMQKYEFSAESTYKFENGKVVKNRGPWVVEENGKKYYSLEAAPAALQFIKQLYDLLQ